MRAYMTKTSRRLAWCGIGVLVAIGVIAVLGRALALVDTSLDFNPARPVLNASALKEISDFDRGFTAHPLLTVLHIVPSGLFLILASFQFSSRIRKNYLRFHRWSGRVLVAAGVIAAMSAIFLEIVFPYGGPIAASAVFLFSSIFLAAILRAFIAIRHRDAALHREWMIRAFSIAIGVSTIRIAGSVIYAITKGHLQDLVGPSFWIGWAITFAAAEFWIRRSRPGPVSIPRARATVAEG